MFSQFKIDDYTCIEILLDNQYAGRTTYLAQDNAGQNVILKKFEFATPRSSWSAIKAIEKEMKVLKSLAHPQIPKYLDYLETELGFVLVIEYINASQLGCFKKRFTIEEVKAIVQDILNILVYLQKQIPPVVHRDIKPENILWDGKKAYLIDFGIASAATQTMTLTSTVGGTIGFTPPEILRGRKATLNSDLYSLGATLFCLLKNISSSEISNYISFDGTFDWSNIVLEITDEAYRWLQKLSHPNLVMRFQTPFAALKQIDALKPKFKEKTVNKIGDILTEEIEYYSKTKIFSTVKNYERIPQKIIKKKSYKLSLYQKIFSIFNVGNALITLFMTIFTIVPLAPPIFLAINILSEKERLGLVYFTIMAIYCYVDYMGYIIYLESTKNTFENKSSILNRQLITFFFNITLRIIELLCLYEIYIHPDYYY